MADNQYSATSKAKLRIAGEREFTDEINVPGGQFVPAVYGLTATKVGLFGVTPVVQPAAAAQAAVTPTESITGADTVDAGAVLAALQAVETLVNAVRSAAVATGMMKGSA